MATIVQITFWSLMTLVVAQGLLVSGFVLRLLRFRRTLIPDAAAPRGTVILCLRGGDPFLKDCLQGLLAQDYPCYDVQVIVDHPDDPAMAILRDVMADETSDRIRVQYLARPLGTCSLKCNSLVQAVESLDESIEFIAQLDADTIPHATWLRELATALQEDGVGAATGNRWYMPSRPSMASLIRYAWNAAAIVQMYWYQIAWGGTLAIKTSVFRETDLLDKWSHAFCEDTMLFTQLKKAGLRLAFVPSLMMVNREDCDLPGFYRWVQRQLLTARLYHPAWFAVVGHGVLTTAAPLLAAVVAVLVWLQGDDTHAAITAVGLVGYEAAIVLMLVPLEFAVRRVVAARGEATDWLSFIGAGKVCLTILLTQVVYPTALYAATRMRNTNWRGICYRIAGSWEIELVEYKRYVPAQAESSVSL